MSNPNQWQLTDQQEESLRAKLRLVGYVMRSTSHSRQIFYLSRGNEVYALILESGGWRLNDVSGRNPKEREELEIKLKGWFEELLIAGGSNGQVDR